MDVVGIVYDVQFVDEVVLIVYEKGPFGADFLTQGACGFLIINGDGQQSAVVDLEFGLQVAGIELQLEHVFGSVSAAPEDKDSRPAAHEIT